MWSADTTVVRQAARQAVFALFLQDQRMVNIRIIDGVRLLAMLGRRFSRNALC